MMLFKRGQLTIFIIIAVLIIAIVSLFFIFRDEIIKKEVINSEVAPIQNFVQECLDDSLEDVVFRIGENGGYYFLGSAPAKTELLEVPYYIKNNKNLMPSKEKIELEISKYIDEVLPLCAGNFTEFSDFQISNGEPKTQTLILDNEIILNVNYPLVIMKGEEKSRIEKFENIKIPVRLGIIYNASSFIVNEHLKNTEEICMSCLLDLQTKENLSIMTQGNENNTIIYNIYSEDYLFNNKGGVPESERYLFRFAVEY